MTRDGTGAERRSSSAFARGARSDPRLYRASVEEPDGESSPARRLAAHGPGFTSAHEQVSLHVHDGGARTSCGGPHLRRGRALSRAVREAWFAGRFPSGQRGQTVNLMALPSQVRILFSPPLVDGETRTFDGAATPSMTTAARSSGSRNRSPRNVVLRRVRCTAALQASLRWGAFATQHVRSEALVLVRRVGPAMQSGASDPEQVRAARTPRVYDPVRA